MHGIGSLRIYSVEESLAIIHLYNDQLFEIESMLKDGF
jgi:hypothetical protein